MDSNPSDLGGFKEIIFGVSGQDVYKRLKYEMGVHRVQRVPATEAQGRIHTSTATVAVLPEAQEVDIEIKPEDLEINVCRASGHANLIAPGTLSVYGKKFLLKMGDVPVMGSTNAPYVIVYLFDYTWANICWY